MKHTVEGPRERKNRNMSAWCRIVAEDGSTVGYTPDHVTALQHAAAPELYAALKYMNHMGGDERGGYCICPRKDGSAPDGEHATVCADARAAIAKVEGR